MVKDGRSRCGYGRFFDFGVNKAAAVSYRDNLRSKKLRLQKMKIQPR